MTKDELLKLAIEAGEYADTHHEKHGSWLDAERHQFATLVAAAEREACASLCGNLHWLWHMGDSSGPKECAEAIRARSQS